jgi:cell division protein YceG involved in septum cleavage
MSCYYCKDGEKPIFASLTVKINKTTILRGVCKECYQGKLIKQMPIIMLLKQAFGKGFDIKEGEYNADQNSQVSVLSG